jgi:hypothetical protein
MPANVDWMKNISFAVRAREQIWNYGMCADEIRRGEKCFYYSDHSIRELLKIFTRTGAPIAAGSTITLQKDGANTAAFIT